MLGLRVGWGRRSVLRGVMNPGVWLRRRGAAVCLPGLLGLRVGRARRDRCSPARVHGRPRRGSGALGGRLLGAAEGKPGFPRARVRSRPRRGSGTLGGRLLRVPGLGLGLRG